jgi:outer membrane protein OmpA-like peptidoglycan-associated protein
MRLLTLSIILSALVFAGCSKTTVILLPDSNNIVGKVAVSTDKGTQVLDKPNQYTEVSGSSASAPKVMQQAKIKETFKDAINVLPKKPVSFLLYFKFGTSELTAESKTLISQVVESVKEREPSNVSIIGHSDTMGPAAYNVTLSLNRAESIKKLLLKKGVENSKIMVSSHGENDLLVKTPNGVSNRKNRRVEIMVK